VKNISFDGRHAIHFSLLTDDEKRDLLRTVQTFLELPNGCFIASFSGRLIRLRKADVEQSKVVQSRSNFSDLMLPGDRMQTRYNNRNAAIKRTRLSKKAPGTIALKLVDFLCNPKTVEKTFKPLVADWRCEYFEALTANRRLKARWISVRYVWYFVLALGISRVLSVVRPVLPSVFRSGHDLDNR
jgi:hypothetical protein